MKASNNKEEKPHFVKRDKFAITAEYKQWFADIKSRLRNSQIKAAIKVNGTLLEFYWSLGRDIVKMKAEQAWGSGVLQQLSFYLRDTSDDESICQQLVGELSMPQKFALVPWGHHIEIMAKSKSVDEALFYINEVIAGNWSRATLMNMQKAGLYERRGRAQTNFNNKLPQPQDELAQEILKDPYNFDFLTLREPYNEHMLEEALEHNIRRFLLELGTGFAYVGSQMELRMPGGTSYFPDMVFYHTKLKCYVVLELKVVEFEPEFDGKLNFYVSAADHLLKDDNDNPSIGLLVCKSKNETVVKWAFEGIDRPLGVATYELDEVLKKTLAEKLPSIEDIENAIEE